MKFSNMKIGTRLGLGFTVVLLLTALVIGLGITMLGRLNDQAERVSDINLPRLLHVNTAGDHLDGIAIAVRDLLLNDDPNIRKAALVKIKESRKALDEELGFLAKTLARPEVRDRLLESGKSYALGVEKIVGLYSAGDADAAVQSLNQELLPIYQGYKATMDDINQFQVSETRKATNEIVRIYQSSRLILAALGVAAIAAGVVFGWLITRSITRPIAHAVGIAGTVASGDLMQRIEVHSTDETGQLLQALRSMNDSLVKTVSHIRTGAETISTATGQIAAGNQDLSSRTEEQASSLEETASSMEELASAVRQNTDNARQANQLALTASSVAKQGGEAVAEVVGTMRSISESSSRISEIVTVIDGIAFQTNILALNAAVEAARAGEQGKGFAVVASEVRVLAQRSASAAKEIKGLIDDSVSRVSIGAEQAERAGTTMREVVESVQRVTDIMSEISAASEEQGTGIEQVNVAITQMDQVTQQNASLVEEAAAASEALMGQAKGLMHAVSVFKLDDAQAIAAQPRKTADVTPPKPAVAAFKPKPLAKSSARLTVARVPGNAEDNWEEF